MSSEVSTGTGRRLESFESFGTAARFRDYLQRMVHRELDKRYPGDRYGYITGIDYDIMKAYVLFEGEDVPVQLPFPASCQPSEIFQRVRVSGEKGDRYISAISNGSAVTDPDTEPPVGGFTPNFINASLTNDWESYGSGYAPPGYRRTSEGRVLLRGVLVNPVDGTGGDVAFTLPAGYRPEYKVLIGNVSDAFDAPNRIEIATTGAVNVWGLTWVSLDAITYDASRKNGSTNGPVSLECGVADADALARPGCPVPPRTVPGNQISGGVTDVRPLQGRPGA